MTTASQKTTAKKPSEETTTSGKYYYGLGRRKRSIAQVRLYSDNKKEYGKVVVNGKPIETYFSLLEKIADALKPLQAAGLEKQFYISVKVIGGGTTGQAGAISLGIARALEKYDAKLRSELKKRGMLSRDPREKERKKIYLRGARKGRQYTKR